MHGQSLAVSIFLHVCAAAVLVRGLPSSVGAHVSSTTNTVSRTFVLDPSEVEVEVDAPKARPHGTLSGSDRAGARAGSGFNATAGERGAELSASATDARFGMVALVESSREVNANGTDAWAPPAGGGANGVALGLDISGGLGVWGTGLGATHDGLGLGLGTLGARGLTGSTSGSFAPERSWSETWHGGWSSGYAPHRMRIQRGPRITHPSQLSPNGPLPGDIIVRYVRAKNASLLRCYSDALRDRSELAGSLTIDFLIDTEGTVVAVKDGGGSVGDRALIACMMHTFGALAFPDALGRTRVSYVMGLHTGP